MCECCRNFFSVPCLHSTLDCWVRFHPTTSGYSSCVALLALALEEFHSRKFQLSDINNSVITISSSSCLAAALVHSAICRHEPPQRTVLSQVDCFIQCEVASFQISLDGVHPRDCGQPGGLVSSPQVGSFNHVMWGHPGGLLPSSGGELQPRDVRTPWWSPPILGWGASTTWCGDTLVVSSRPRVGSFNHVMWGHPGGLVFSPQVEELQPHDVRTPWWSRPVLRWGASTTWCQDTPVVLCSVLRWRSFNHVMWGRRGGLVFSPQVEELQPHDVRTPWWSPPVLRWWASTTWCEDALVVSSRPRLGSR